MSLPLEVHPAAAESPRGCSDVNTLKPMDTIQTGDMIRLGQGASPDFRGCPAVVTHAGPAHCTVAVLDPSRRIAIGECWPNYCDCMLISSLGRLGSRVFLDGFQKGRGKFLNGSVGTIVLHKTEGHPSFVQRSCADSGISPVLVCCVELDRPPSTKEKQVLIELSYMAKLPDAPELARALADVAALAGDVGAEGLGLQRTSTSSSVSTPRSAAHFGGGTPRSTGSTPRSKRSVVGTKLPSNLPKAASPPSTASHFEDEAMADRSASPSGRCGQSQSAETATLESPRASSWQDYFCTCRGKDADSGVDAYDRSRVLAT